MNLNASLAINVIMAKQFRAVKLTVHERIELVFYPRYYGKKDVFRKPPCNKR